MKIQMRSRGIDFVDKKLKNAYSIFDLEESRQ